MQNVSAHLLRPDTGLQLQPAVASSQLAAQGQPAAAYQAASASSHLQLTGMMDRFTDAERKQLAFSVLIAGASVLSSAQQQQQAMQAAAVRPGSVQGGAGCGQHDLGSCSRTGTPASSQAASMRNAGHAYYASKCSSSCLVQSQAHQSGCHGQRVQGTMPAALEDSTSPLSSSSFALVRGVLTPCGAEAVSAARVGCKRSYDAVEEQQQYQQVLLSHHQQQARAHDQQATGIIVTHQQQSAAKLLASQQQQARQQQTLLLLKQRQAAQQQQQAHLQRQAVAQQQQYHAASQLHQQLAAQQQRQQQQLQTLLAVGQHLASGPHTASAAVQDAVAKAAAAAAAASRGYGATAASAAHPQQQLLMPQGSGTSTSSGFSSTTAAAPAGTSAFGGAAASSIWQQLVQVQEQKCLLGTAATAPATAPGMHLQQQVPLLGGASSLTTSSSSSSGGCASIFAGYLQHHQQARRRLQQQPPAKRAATQATVAALLGASTAAAGQQQLAATHGSSNSLQTLALLPPSAASAGPRRALAETGANRLLAWAGQVLCCQVQDAYHLAAHIFKRTAGRLDDMLLISLGATLPVDSVTMLVSLWLATKLEGHRRQVAGCSKLAGALQLLPWAVTSIELHMMQLMDWQPYAGWLLRPQEPSCTVAEY